MKSLLFRTIAVSGVASAILAAGVFVGVRLASATPGGPTRNAFTFAGTLRESSGAPRTTPTMLTFTFHRTGLPDCTPPAVMALPNSSGAFSVLVPIDTCANNFFDGADITYDIAQAGESTPIATAVAITPVPYARFADQAGVNNDCPSGYSRSTATADAMYTVCVRRRTDGSVYDEVVKVGTGASSFWIDRYETSFWQNRDATGTQYGVAGVGLPDTFPANGQGLPSAWVYTASMGGVLPGNAGMTWFQADILCRATGKRLPTNTEWQFAAQGTSDPGANDGLDGRCRTMASALDRTGLRLRCVSSWGAQDMIGNVREVVADWVLAPTTGSGSEATWPSVFGNDLAVDLYGTPFAVGGATDTRLALPATLSRSGGWNDGVGAGLFWTSLHYGVTYSQVTGVRCVVPHG